MRPGSNWLWAFRLPRSSPVDVPAHVGAQVVLHAPLHQLIRLLLAVQAVEQQALHTVSMRTGGLALAEWG